MKILTINIIGFIAVSVIFCGAMLVYNQRELEKNLAQYKASVELTASRDRLFFEKAGGEKMLRYFYYKQWITTKQQLEGFRNMKEWE